MIVVEVSNGELVTFPDDMTDAEITAELRKRFPPPRPESLQPGETHTRPNSASVGFNAVMRRYVVQNSQGRPYGFRPTLDAAIDLADTIPPPPPPTPKPKPQNPIDPEVEEAQIRAEVGSSIRRREAQERQQRLADYRQRRFKNRGTLG